MLIKELLLRQELLKNLAIRHQDVLQHPKGPQKVTLLQNEVHHRVAGIADQVDHHIQHQKVHQVVVVVADQVHHRAHHQNHRAQHHEEVDSNC